MEKLINEHAQVMVYLGNGKMCGGALLSENRVRTDGSKYRLSYVQLNDRRYRQPVMVSEVSPDYARHANANGVSLFVTR